jgi:hypothetical protein
MIVGCVDFDLLDKLWIFNQLLMVNASAARGEIPSSSPSTLTYSVAISGWPVQLQ